MRALLRKFAGQLITACLLLGTLIPADAHAQAKKIPDASSATNREEIEQYVREMHQRHKTPEAEIEQRVNAAGQLWDAAQAKGIHAETSGKFAFEIAGRSAINKVERETEAAKKVLDNPDLNVSNSALNPMYRGNVLAELTRAERVGISPDRQKAMRDLAEEMAPTISPIEKKASTVAQGSLELAMQRVMAGDNPEEAKQKAEALIGIGMTMQSEGKGTSAINEARRALDQGAEPDVARKVADIALKLKEEGKGQIEINAAVNPIIDAAKKGVSDELLEKTAETAAEAAGASVQKTGSTLAAETGASIGGKAVAKGIEKDPALEAAEKGSDMMADLEKKVGQRGAAAASSTIVQGTLNGQANTEEAALAAAETGQKAADEGKGGALVEAGGNAVGQAMLKGKTREDAEKIGGTVETAAEKSLDAGHGLDAMNVGAQSAFDVLVQTGVTPQAESTEAQTEEKEETPTQPTQTEEKEKEETPTQPTQPTPNE